MKKIPKLKGFTETIEDYVSAAKKGKILRLGIQLNTPSCNWHCPYCYAPDKIDQSKFSSIEKVKSWIKEGVNLGVTAVTINGTFEPTTSKDLFPVLEYCRNLDLTTLLVTNSLLLNERRVSYLKDLEVSVLMKLNTPISFPSEKTFKTYQKIQTFMAGKSNSIYETTLKKLQLLVDYGFAEERIENGITTTSLGVESVIAKQNIDHLPKLVRQLRSMNVYSHLEIIKEQGFCQDGLSVPRQKLQKLFETILKNDLEEGYEGWIPKPPYVAGTCYQNLIRLNVHADGKVGPCPGIELTLGDLEKEDSLKSIVDNSKQLAIIRNLGDLIEGDCKSCDYMKDNLCYGGCRGTAFQELKKKGYPLNKLLVASDPSCWRVEKVLD